MRTRWESAAVVGLDNLGGLLALMTLVGRLPPLLLQEPGVRAAPLTLVCSEGRAARGRPPAVVSLLGLRPLAEPTVSRPRAHAWPLGLGPLHICSAITPWALGPSPAPHLSCSPKTDEPKPRSAPHRPPPSRVSVSDGSAGASARWGSGDSGLLGSSVHSPVVRRQRQPRTLGPTRHSGDCRGCTAG